MRTITAAQSYIDNLEITQYQEQDVLASLRERGITKAQVIDPLLPIFLNTLNINQVTPIFTDLQRDNIIDYFIL